MRRLLRRLSYLLRHRRFETDLAEEMAFHREMKQRELEQGGVNTDEARLAAHRAFGSAALAEDHSRDVWIWPWLQDVSSDVRFAVRLLVKDRWFAFVVVMTLALGIGLSATMFS